MAQKRSCAVGGKLAGHLYVCGGFDNPAHLNTVERLAIGSDHWETIPQMVEQRSSAAAAVFGGCLWVCGGSDAVTKHLNSCECFNQDVRVSIYGEAIPGVWEARPPLVVPRSGAIAGYAGSLVIFGGFDGCRYLGTAEC